MEQGPLPPTRARMPDPSGVDFADPVQVKAYVTSLTMSISLALQQRPVETAALPAQIYRSPNGTAYRMTVDDAGVPAYTQVGT